MSAKDSSATRNGDLPRSLAIGSLYALAVLAAGLFFMVGVVYDRVHHRNLNEFGGLFGKMPVYTALSIGIFFAGLGLPGLCGFVGEVLVESHALEDDVVVALLTPEKVEQSSGQRYLKARRPELYGKLVEPQESVTLPGWSMQREKRGGEGS